MAWHQKAVVVRKHLLRAPPSAIEYTFYGVLCYSMLGEAWGVSVPMGGAGLLAILAGLCLMHFGPRAIDVCRPIALALGCAISTLLLQLVFHGESLLNGHMRGFITWTLSLVVIQSISLRQGFLQRFGLMAFLIGCGTLPYLKVYQDEGELVRMGAEGVGLSNPNLLAMWFGFCAIFLLITGIETRNNWVRLPSWLAAVLCMYIVGITVSRGSILGVAIATAFAFQKVLKRSFLPILMFLFLGWIIFVSGIFDEIFGYYMVRGEKSTGRSDLWESGLNRFLLSAWFEGGGFPSVLLDLRGHTEMVDPHNPLLFIGLATGIIPLVFFVGYLMRAARGAFRAGAERTPFAPYKLPLFIFALLQTMTSSTVFMTAWPMVAFSTAMAAVHVPRASRIIPGKRATGPGSSGKRASILAKTHP